MKRLISILIVFVVLLSGSAVADTVNIPEKDQGIVVEYLNEQFPDLERIFDYHPYEILVSCMVAAQMTVVDDTFDLRIQSSKKCDDIVTFIGIGKHQSGNSALLFAFQDLDLSYKIVCVIPAVSKFFYFEEKMSRDDTEDTLKSFCKDKVSSITYQEVIAANELVGSIADELYNSPEEKTSQAVDEGIIVR